MPFASNLKHPSQILALFALPCPPAAAPPLVFRIVLQVWLASLQSTLRLRFAIAHGFLGRFRPIQREQWPRWLHYC